MIQSYFLENALLHPGSRDLASAIWIDLANPTAAERAEVEAALSSEIPSQEEMHEIEISSRLYSCNHTAYMTTLLPAKAEGGDPAMGPVTFMLSATHLVTIRYHSPCIFNSFPPRALANRTEMAGPQGVLLALLEAVIDHQADILERAAAEIDAQSCALFQPADKGKSRDFQTVLQKIGQMGNLNSHTRDSLLTLERLTSFLGALLAKDGIAPELREQNKTLASDVKSLVDHANFLASKITFLLDATLGLITMEQNGIIKIFSVASVIFLPPTLIASLYGMNFANMPELQWAYGYPYALGLMVVCAVLPYLYFKYKKWL